MNFFHFGIFTWIVKLSILQGCVEERKQVVIYNPCHKFPVDRTFESKLRGERGEQGQVGEIVVSSPLDFDDAEGLFDVRIKPIELFIVAAVNLVCPYLAEHE